MTIASPPQVTKPRPRARRRAWKLRVEQGRLADLLPAQGEWTADDYLWLSRDTNHLIEWADGWIEELPMPTVTHQRISKRLLLLLDAWLEARGGVIYYSPLRLRVSETRFREPDLLAFLDAADARNADDYWRGADLVVEIISPGNADHDLVTKRLEYAEARIPEYWIVDTQSPSLTVLALESDAYREHGRFAPGENATSPLLPGSAVAMDVLFAVR